MVSGGWPGMYAVMAEAGLILGGRYRLRARIGAGGMGEVWWATDLALRRIVAIKLVRSDHVWDEEGRARFRAEGRHAAALAHQNIVRVYDYCSAGPAGLDYLVMEYVNGPSLARLLDGGPLDPVRTMNVVAQAARGLQAAHEAGVVHRDVKPANLLVSRDGRVAVTDFGIAYAAGSVPVTRAGMVMGSPAYMAPERVSGSPATPATDLYALGVVAYECLTGRIPFDGEPLAVAAAHIEATMPPLPSWVPADVARLVADLTARDPAERPAHAAEVAERAEHVPAAAAPAAPAAAEAGFGTVRATVTLSPAAPARGVPRRSAGPARGPRGPRRAARTALPVGALATAGLVAWVLATTPGPGPAHQPSAAPAASSPAATPPLGSSPSAPGGRSRGPAPVPDRGSQPPARAEAASPAASAPGAAPAPGPGPAKPLPPGPAKPLPPGQAKRLARGLLAPGPETG
jgi:eukaryotic-like serine/threonine-protein kinase